MSLHGADPMASTSAAKRLSRARLDSSFQESIDAILRNQSSSGAIVASPDFAQYHFCWLRDGSFSAFALDRAGEHRSVRPLSRVGERRHRRH